jgi:hypothetical protein
MTNTLIISENKLKAFSDINNAVDPDLLVNAVREAQDIHIQLMLGYNLYQSILTKIQTNTLTGNYQLIVNNYVQDCLLYWAYYEALEAIWMRPRNNGLLIPQGGDQAQPVDLKIYEMKRQSVKDKAQFYGERLVGYLIDNSSLFPEFQTETGMEIFPDQRTRYGSPFVFRNNLYASELRDMGIKITDSRYYYLPQ